MTRGILLVIFCFEFIFTSLEAQVSPGKLAKVHSEFEGINNCTKCHVLGEDVTNEKCLDCHTEINNLIRMGKGYHSSGEVIEKECASCHSDHHGLAFEMIRFDENKFKHDLTGYKLTGQHENIDCRDCHQSDLIANADLKARNNTFLGLDQQCNSCHEDVHQQTLSGNCTECHNTTAFNSITGFNHDKTDFSLVGQHKSVNCVKCHPIVKRNGKDFQKFADLEFNNCTACHEDVHNDKFGSNCVKCHTMESFHKVRSLESFNHNITDFRIEGMHLTVECKECHVRNYTEPVPHSSCISCHEDYHKGQFVKNNEVIDCAVCHSVDGFDFSSYSIADHNTSDFPLKGAHQATPCFACHQQENNWNFSDLGERCVDCHKDIHSGNIPEKYYPDQSCMSCHSLTQWKNVSFDHLLTGFKLLGAHESQKCLNCHKDKSTSISSGNINFSEVSGNCAACHDDVHYHQFDKQGVTDCTGCHKGFNNWHISEFNHDMTAFKLDGKHTDAGCSECHPEISKDEKIFVKYKLNSFECIDCHQ